MVPGHAAAFSFMVYREFFQYKQMMPRVAFSFDPLMMGLFVNLQLLGLSSCISSHFRRTVNFKIFPGKHVPGTPLDDSRLDDRFSPPHPYFKIPSAGLAFHTIVTLNDAHIIF